MLVNQCTSNGKTTRMQMTFIHIHQARLYYQLYSPQFTDKLPILLIHGFPTAAWDWHKLWPVLAGRYRLVAPDLLGFGYSAKPRNYPYSFAAQADLCEQALAERGIERYLLLAHDYGDTVAQELLARRIERGDERGPSRVCLLNGGIFPDAQQPTRLQRLLAGPLGPLLARALPRRAIERGLARVFGADTQPSAEELATFLALIDHRDGRLLVPKLLGYLDERRRHADRWVGALLASPAPLLLVDGLLDPVSGSNMTTRWRAALPDAGLVELTGVGHYPQIEAPAAVLEACERFFGTPREAPGPAARGDAVR
jgi:pimeloyl-ACP methyl ester carboxylesterase